MIFRSIRILTQRALKPGPAWDHLLEQLASEKASKRSKALLTLRFISERHAGTSQYSPCLIFYQVPERPLPQYSSYQFWQPNFLSAIVASLGKLIPGVHLAFVEQKYPSDDQVIALEILSILLYDISDSNLQRLCDAGLITEWLARYPFLKDAPADRPKTEAKAEAVRNFVKWSEGEPCHTPDMRDILILLLTKQSVRAQLVDAGIWSFKFDHQDEKERMRHVEESPEEVQLRRRRREAVVIGEEGRAITRRDIYQRGDDIGEEGVEDQLEHLWEVEEAVRRDNASHRGFWDIVRRLRPDGLSPQ